MIVVTTPTGNIGQQILCGILDSGDRSEVACCPFLRVAAEYSDLAHPFHRRVIEQKDKLLACLIDLLKPFAIDRTVAAAPPSRKPDAVRTSPATNTVVAFGGLVAFVIEWHDEESRTPEWRERERAAREYSLF